jgi:hypothetical protein
MKQVKGYKNTKHSEEEAETGGDSERKKPRGSHIINL